MEKELENATFLKATPSHIVIDTQTAIYNFVNLDWSDSNLSNMLFTRIDVDNGEDRPMTRAEFNACLYFIEKDESLSAALDFRDIESYFDAASKHHHIYYQNFPIPTAQDEHRNREFFLKKGEDKCTLVMYKDGKEYDATLSITPGKDRFTCDGKAMTGHEINELHETAEAHFSNRNFFPAGYTEKLDLDAFRDNFITKALALNRQAGLMSRGK